MRFRGADALGPEHVGRRVTVRYRLPDGRATDVVGVLERLDDRVIIVRDRRDAAHELARADIVAARVVRRPQ